jgi:cell division protein FtsA
LTFYLKYNILIAAKKYTVKMEEFVLAIGDIIVGIDIGTSKVNTSVGEVNSFNQIEVIATSECKCFGMKKSKITDEEEIAAAVAKTTKEDRQSYKKNGREYKKEY